MRFIHPRHQFLFYWLSGGTLFLSLLTLSFYFQVYKIFPEYGFIGYSLVIFTVMVALNKATMPWHFVLVSISLILFGTAASLDIVLSKGDMVTMLSQSDSEFVQRLLNEEDGLDDYIDVLLILLNVFTSAIAGNALFYGLNRRNFDRSVGTNSLPSGAGQADN